MSKTETALQPSTSEFRDDEIRFILVEPQVMIHGQLHHYGDYFSMKKDNANGKE